MEIYLGGCSGIKNPVDIDGEKLSVEDRLTWNFGESKEIKGWMMEPCFEVKRHESGGYYGAGIGKYRKYYLHDFCFKYCRKYT